jgi:hypothetical protein
MEKYIIYSVGIVIVGWLISITIQIINLIRLWLKDKLLTIKELRLWD